MATVFLLDYPHGLKDKAGRNTATIIDRWAERQGGAAFVSCDTRFIMTDYVHDHREVELLRHIINCCGISYRCIGNVDLAELGEMIFRDALTTNKNNKQ